MAKKVARRTSSTGRQLAPAEFVEHRIHVFRGDRVMLDRDLAELYQVPTKVMNLAVRRHADRFPADFMFQLTTTEWKILRFQFETSNPGAGGRRYVPHVFTEQGVAMLSSVLNSQRAVQVNIAVMRAFVRLREYAANYKGLGDRLAAMEPKYDSKFKVVFDAIRGLLNPPLRTDEKPASGPSTGWQPG